MAPHMTQNVARTAALVAVLLCALGAGAYLLLGAGNQARSVSVSHAVAQPMTGAMPGLMISMTLENSGAPVMFSAISSPVAGNTHIMGGELDEIVLPGEGTFSFALDGAHVMMMAVSGDLDVGRLVPLQFTLGDGSILKTQVTIAGADRMDHSMHSGMQGMSIDPLPVISLRARIDDASGQWVVSSDVQDFTFDTEFVDTQHVPGAGHGHLYLNDVKLGRYYGGDFVIGYLPKGDHRVRLDLNTNLHQPYVVDGEAVSGSLVVSVP